MVASALTLANTLAANASSSSQQINPLSTSIQQAYGVFYREATSFASASQIDSGLRAALYFSRAAAALSAAQLSAPGVRYRLQIAALQLNRVNTLMGGGSSSASASDAAHASSPMTQPIIGPADIRSSASLAPVVTSGSLGIILGDATISPLATQTSSAAQSANGSFPYELSGVSVTIGGKAAQLIAVSPTQVNFYIPTGLPSGVVELLVTSQDGYVSQGTTFLYAVAPSVFTASGDGTGAGAVLNANTLAGGTFDVTTAANLGTDKRTRLMFFATGISSGAANTNTANDITTGSGTIINVAESVTVEARRSNGSTTLLPVEYAGTRGNFPGLDQVNVVLPSTLRGAGTVEMTIIVNNQRSNSVTVSIR